MDWVRAFWIILTGAIPGFLATWLGICSLPAIANKVPRQIAVVKKIPHIIIVDGCHDSCASNILDQLDIHYDEHINLEDLGIKKLGPFTALKYDQEDLEKVYRALTSRVKIYPMDQVRPREHCEDLFTR